MWYQFNLILNSKNCFPLKSIQQSFSLVLSVGNFFPKNALGHVTTDSNMLLPLVTWSKSGQGLRQFVLEFQTRKLDGPRNEKWKI